MSRKISTSLIPTSASPPPPTQWALRIYNAHGQCVLGEARAHRDAQLASLLLFSFASLFTCALSFRIDIENKVSHTWSGAIAYADNHTCYKLKRIKQCSRHRQRCWLDCLNVETCKPGIQRFRIPALATFVGTHSVSYRNIRNIYLKFI